MPVPSKLRRRSQRRGTSADAAGEDARTAVLWALSSEDGKKLGACKLISLPVFDGMIAAYGRLYMATTDGKVVCFAGHER